MDRLWVRFSLAIILVTMAAFGLATAFLFFNPWSAPLDERDSGNVLSPRLNQSQIDTLVQELSKPGIEQSEVSIFSDGFFTITGVVAGKNLDGLSERLPMLMVSIDEPTEPDNEAGNAERPLPGADPTEHWPRTFNLDGQIDPQQITSFSSRLPVDTVQINTDPLLVTNLSISDIYRLLYDHIWQAALVSIVLGLGLGILLSRTLTSPLNHLSEAARAIGAKDLSRRVPVRGSREVAALAATFNQMAAELERSEHLRRQMMADVSHELRTPLAGLESNLRAALDQVHQLEEADLAQLYSHTRHLIALVNDLHEIALTEGRQLALNQQPLDLGELVAQTITIFLPLAEEKGVTLASSESASPLLVKGDARRLRQVLHNLLGNALRHTPSGGTITCTLERQAGACRVSIKDTGEGIAAEHLPLIFERFYRADPSRSRELGGTGLGLAIAKAIAEAHDGTLSATSSGPGQGATFTLSLPEH